MATFLPAATPSPYTGKKSVHLHLVLAAQELPNDNPSLSDPCGVLDWRTPMPSSVLDPTLELAPDLLDAAEDDGADILVVDELTPIEPSQWLDGTEAVDFELEPAPASAESEADPFAQFVRTLVEVAHEAGCARAAALLPALLEGGKVDDGALGEATIDALVMAGVLARAPGALVAGEQFRKTADAWRAVLRGDCNDLSDCGSRMLDEWAADLVARLIAAPAKTEQLRRELRTRGVAAFGLVLAA